ncbi:MAG: ROK family protein [Planctomycetaceae bacterium]
MSDGTRVRVGFDLGGTKMFAAVFDEDYKLLGKERKKTKGHQGVAAGVERVSQAIREALADADVAPDRLAGIGVGCPGVLDIDEGVLIDAVNLGWRDVRLKEILEREFGCPAVLANDVDAGVYGEYRFGAGRGAFCLLGVFPGTGIGGGCIYRGQIFRGRKQSCMEIGHMPLFPFGPRDGTGHLGTLEAYSSRLAISAAAAQAAFRGQAPNLMKAAGTDLAEIRSGTLAAAIKAGDKAVERAVADAGEMIGIAVGGVVNLLSPDVIVLGGGLVEAMPELFVSTVSDSARRHAMEAFQDTFKVVAAELGDNATVMGAAAWQEASTGDTSGARKEGSGGKKPAAKP